MVRRGRALRHRISLVRSQSADEFPKGCARAEQLQATIQNAQLAGNIRVAGLYNLGRLSVDAYSYLAGISPVSLTIFSRTFPCIRLRSSLRCFARMASAAVFRTCSVGEGDATGA